MRFQIQRRVSHRELQGVSKNMRPPACRLTAYLPFLGHSAFLQFVFSCNLYFFTIPMFSAVCPFAQKFAVVCPIALCDGVNL